MLAQGQVAGKGPGVFDQGITKKSKEKNLRILVVVDAGCVAISDDGRPVMNSLVMRRALEYAKAFWKFLCCGPLRRPAFNRWRMHERGMSIDRTRNARDWPQKVMVARNLALADLTGGSCASGR